MMQLHLIQLTDKTEILDTYGIYRHCMYLPTEEKFAEKVTAFLNDDSIGIFACCCDGQILGVAVASFSGADAAEIVGIAVEPSVRYKGIGSFMIDQLVQQYGLRRVLAETDDDAVDFYRKNGFCAVEFIEEYDGEAVTRYRCEWKK